MKIITTVQYLQARVSNLHQRKCEEIKRICKHYSHRSDLISIRQQEANELQELTQGHNQLMHELTNLNATELHRLESYSGLDKYLTKITAKDPSLKGHILILGQNKPELFSNYSLVCFNIPITFYRS